MAHKWYASFLTTASVFCIHIVFSLVISPSMLYTVYCTVAALFANSSCSGRQQILSVAATTWLLVLVQCADGVHSAEEAVCIKEHLELSQQQLLGPELKTTRRFQV